MSTKRAMSTMEQTQSTRAAGPLACAVLASRHLITRKAREWPGLLQLLRHARGQALLACGRAELRSAPAPAQPLLLRLSPWPCTHGFASGAEPPDDAKPPGALAQSDSEEDAEGAHLWSATWQSFATLCVCADVPPVLWQSWTRLLSASAGGNLRSVL